MKQKDYVIEAKKGNLNWIKSKLFGWIRWVWLLNRYWLKIKFVFNAGIRLNEKVSEVWHA